MQIKVVTENVSYSITKEIDKVTSNIDPIIFGNL